MPAAPRPDQTPLSPAERQAVLMLGAGHTAKSIAGELGISVHAVNERLREARRKAGAASSRELARVLLAQENRDKQIGVPEGACALPAPGSTGVASVARRDRRKDLAVISLLALAAIAAWQIGHHPAPAVPIDAASPDVGTAAALHAQLLTERRDDAWARDAEPMLDSFYAPLAGVGRITVTCRATLCEVAGEVSPRMMDAVMDEVQGAALAQRVRAAGFPDSPAVAFKLSSDADRPGSFTVYWRRAG